MGQQDPELLATTSGSEIDGSVPEHGVAVAKLREQLVRKTMQIKRMVS